MKRILVTDGRSRASLAIVRSLGRKGLEVTSGEAFPCLTFFSKYKKNRLIYPSPSTEPDLFMQRIFEELDKYKFDMIIPVRDDVTILLSKYKDKLSNLTRVPVADYNSIITARDKAKTIEAAMKLNIPCPKTTFIEDNNDLTKIKNKLEYPVVIKPHKSSGSRGILYIQSPEELLRGYNKAIKQYGSLMIQEFIPPGGSYGVSLLFNKGKALAIHTHKRIREYPISGGPSTLSMSVRYPEIEKYSIRLLKSLNWHGVAMVEFRVDKRDEKPKLMEINPRFWGTLSLSIFSGVDFPYLLYQMEMDNDITSVFDYKIGLKTRWLIYGDILWFLSAPNKLKALPQFLKFRDKDMNYDILSADDPLPSIRAFVDGLRSFLDKKKRTHVFERGW